MTRLEAVHTQLHSDSAIAAKVGERIRPVAIPQRDQQYLISFRWIGGQGTVSHDGDSKLGRGCRLEVTVWGPDPVECEKILALVKLNLGGFRGTMGGIGGVSMWNTGMTTPRDLYDSDSNSHGSQIDFFFDIKESTIS